MRTRVRGAPRVYIREVKDSLPWSSARFLQREVARVRGVIDWAASRLAEGDSFNVSVQIFRVQE
jgi:hypothetical protein